MTRLRLHQGEDTSRRADDDPIPFPARTSARRTPIGRDAGDAGAGRFAPRSDSARSTDATIREVERTLDRLQERVDELQEFADAPLRFPQAIARDDDDRPPAA